MSSRISCIQHQTNTIAKICIHIIDHKDQYQKLAKILVDTEKIKKRQEGKKNFYELAKEIYDKFFSQQDSNRDLQSDQNNSNTQSKNKIEIKDIQAFFQKMISDDIFNDYTLLLNDYAFCWSFFYSKKSMDHTKILINRFLPLFTELYTMISEKIKLNHIKYIPLKNDNILDRISKIPFHYIPEMFNSFYYLENVSDDNNNYYIAFKVSEYNCLNWQEQCIRLSSSATEIVKQFIIGQKNNDNTDKTSEARENTNINHKTFVYIAIVGNYTSAASPQIGSCDNDTYNSNTIRFKSSDDNLSEDSCITSGRISIKRIIGNQNNKP